MSVIPGKYCRRVLVVQGAWVDGRLALWDAGGAPLTGVADGKLDELTVLLPTGDAEPTLAAARLPAVLLDPPDALAWLDTLPDPDALDDAGWVAGPSVRYLAVLAGYAAGLVRRGRLLPQLVRGGEPAARWRPVLTGARRGRVPRVRRRRCRRSARAAARRPVRRRHRCATRSTDSSTPRPGGRCPSGCCSATGPGPRRRWPTAGSCALTADDPTLTGAAAQRGDLADAARRAGAAGCARRTRPTAPIRVCFRLVEPLPGDDELGAGVRASSRPTTRASTCPAELLWAGAAGARAAPTGPTRRCWPGSAAPSGCSRRCTGAARGAAGGDAGSTRRRRTTSCARPRRCCRPPGTGCSCPAWAGRKSVGLQADHPRASGAARPQGRRRRGFGLDQLVDFRVDLVVGDEHGQRRGAGRAGPAQGAAGAGRAASGSSWTTGSSRPRSRRSSGAATGELTVGRGAAARSSTAATRTCRWSRSTPTAGSATCSPGRPTERLTPDRRRRPTFQGTLRPVPGARPVLAALPVPARPGRRPGRRHGPRQDRADAVAAARRARRRRAAVGADAAGLPDVAGQQLAEGGRAVRALAAGLRPPRRRPQARGRARRGRGERRPGHHHLRHRAARPRRAARRRAGAGWCATRRRPSRTAAPGRPRPCGRSRPAPGSR